MKYSRKKHEQIMKLPDSDKKLGKLESLGLSLGCFNRQLIIDECKRLRALGYKSLAQRYIESKGKKHGR